MREILLESIIPQSSQSQIPGNVPEMIPEQTEGRPAYGRMWPSGRWELLWLDRIVHQNFTATAETWEWKQKLGPSAQTSFFDCDSVFQAWQVLVNHKEASVCSWFSRGSTMVTMGIRRNTHQWQLCGHPQPSHGYWRFARLHKRWLHSPSACL